VHHAKKEYPDRIMMIRKFMSTKTGKSSLGFYIAPIIFFLCAYIILNILNPRVIFFPWMQLIDIAIFLFALVAFSFFFSSLINPIQNKNQRKMYVISFFSMLVSRKTPVILIGKQPLSYSRSPHQNHSPAFVNILNDWFAVVQSRRNVRLLSPGISFLDQSQKLIGYFRSDRISIMLGPINENPFAPYNPQMEIESAYQRRLDNRHQCQGFTKDGCEIVPNIYFPFEFHRAEMKFRLKRITICLLSRLKSTN